MGAPEPLHHGSPGASAPWESQSLCAMGALEPLRHGSPGASAPWEPRSLCARGSPRASAHGSPGASAPVGALEPLPMGALEPLSPWEPWSLCPWEPWSLCPWEPWSLYAHGSPGASTPMGALEPLPMGALEPLPQLLLPFPLWRVLLESSARDGCSERSRGVSEGRGRQPAPCRVLSRSTVLRCRESSAWCRRGVCLGHAAATRLQPREPCTRHRLLQPCAKVPDALALSHQHPPR